MSTREFYLERLKAERPAFVNVLRALPADQLGYKPHERNSSAGDIAWFLVLELRSLIDMLEKGEVHWSQPPKPSSLDEIAGQYEAAFDELQRIVAADDGSKWDRKCDMYFGGKLMKSSPFGETAWDFLFDAVHHRGQLTAYLRPMGGKVPSVYGPTADTKAG